MSAEEDENAAFQAIYDDLVRRGMEKEGVELIHILAEGRPCTSEDLARWLGCTVPRVVAVLRVLEQHKLIERGEPGSWQTT